MMKTLLVALFVLVAQSQLSFAAETTTQAGVAVETLTAQVAQAPKVEDNAKLAEDQIPLSIETAKKATDTGSTTAKALMSMVIVAILLATSYYFIRRYRSTNKVSKSNVMQIKVLTQHYLGPKKSLAIIHVAGESILVGITDSNISMIKSLSLIDDEVPANLPNTFGQTLDKAQAAAQNNSPVTMSENKSIPYELDEEFSFSNVTDTVAKKIKSMRSFS